MHNGFIKVAVGAPKIEVANCKQNAQNAIDLIEKMASQGAKICVLPELCITGYACGDLFLQDKLLKSAKDTLRKIEEATMDIDALIFVGLPFEKGSKLYNVAAAICGGRVIAFIPKSNIPSYNEFYETRHFVPAKDEGVSWVLWDDRKVSFGANILLQCNQVPNLAVAAEICEDLWVTEPPSTKHVLAGATIVANLSASNEIVGKSTYRKTLVGSQSARLVCGYAYANAGIGESTTDVVYSGQGLIAENGIMLAQSPQFKNEIAFADIDVDRLVFERRRMSTFPAQNADGYEIVCFDLQLCETKLNRKFDPTPFVPSSTSECDERSYEISKIQSMGLAKRIEHTGCKHVIIGVSGGLDSTLALLVAANAFDYLGLERAGIIAVTMPCFGTSDSTYKNACELATCLGSTLRTINIKNAVLTHFDDIKHDPSSQDVTYENAQARERTQVLMDLANQYGGIVVGTGDLSELALGWTTYNGDHMSMYAPNSSIPKTLVKYLVQYYAKNCEDPKLQDVLQKILDTPISPELLPTKDGKISQKTEELVGPYILHDFFLYYMLRAGFCPAKIYRVAKMAFESKYSSEEILKWLKSFYKRFFSQQFKRSCMPDGPKVGSVALSPRGDLRMPSDASVQIWADELKDLE